MHTLNSTTGGKVIEGSGKRSRPSGPSEKYLASLLPTLGLPLDHHWDEDHPNYDPNCFCGDPSGPKQAANQAAAAAAATEFDHNDDTYEGRRAVTEGRRNRKPMSANQAAYLESLIAQIKARLADESFIVTIRQALDSNITWGEASALINRIRQNLAGAPRSNRYPGNCIICGQNVEAEAGYLNSVGGRWQVEHVECPEPADEPTIEEQAAAASPVEGLDLTSLPAGRYAVPNGETRLKVQVDKPAKGNWKGFIFVRDAAEYGQGRRYGRQKPGYRYEGDIVEALEAIMADPAGAMAEYGHLTGTCGRCFRHLEDELSVKLGIGPVCRGKLAAEVG